MKVLTLNTWQEKGPWRERWEVIFEGLERIRPDIAAFQEVFNPDWAKTIVKRSVFPYSVFSDKPSGLMILSLFPVADWTVYTMKTQSPTENYLRYALFARLEIQGKPLAIFNTHLSWQLDEGRVREKQVGELLKFVNEKAGKGEALAMGDFNSTAGSCEIKKMTEEGEFADNYRVLHPNEPGLTWDNVNPFTLGASHPISDRRIDYIFMRKGWDLLKECVSCKIVFTQPNAKGIFASDHFGVLAEFRK